MPGKKKTKRSRYGDYCYEAADGKLYGVVQLRQRDGSYKRKTKLVESRTKARQWALDQLEKHQNPSIAVHDNLTFREAARWYKEHILIAPVYENKVKVDGIKDYERERNKIDKLTEYFGDKKISEINEDDLLRFARSRRNDDEVLTATNNRYFARMRAMYRTLQKRYQSLRIPEFPINIHAERERDRVLGFDEEKRLLAACVDEETITVKRKGKEFTMTIDAKRTHLKPLIIAALDTAMREGEITSLKWRDIDFDKGVITVQFFNSKTQKSRAIGMTPRVREELLKLYKSSDKRKDSNVFGFKSPERSFLTACKRAGIEDLRFHDLRHSGTTRMVKAGIPTAEVMKTTGHTQLKTFLRYLNLVHETVQSNANQLARYLENES